MGKITKISFGKTSFTIKDSFQGYYGNMDIKNGGQSLFSAKKTNYGVTKKPIKGKKINYPILIIQSIGRKGKKNIVNDKGVLQSTKEIALDLLYGDYLENAQGFNKLYKEIYQEVYNNNKQDGKFDFVSREEYAKNKSQKVLDLVKKFCKKSDDELFGIFKTDAKRLFSQGKLEENIIRMINKMQSKEKEEYSHFDLSQAVVKHNNTVFFVEQVKIWTKKFLIINGGDVEKLRIKDNSEGLIYNSDFKKKVDKPRFNNFGDRFSGLQIATNDIWAYQIYLTDFSFAKNKPRGTLHFDFYDHFGLDYPDIEKYQNDIFIAWFVLQHFRGYPPFITRMSFTSKF